jgi:ferredoxin
MSGSPVVLLCGELAAVELGDVEVTVIDDLCHRPEAAAEALRAAEATRAVLALCEDHGSVADLRAACRRAGAAPFGVEAVTLSPGAASARLLESRLARLRALPPGERGRPALSNGGCSRRGLFSLTPALSTSPVAELDAASCVGTARCGLCVSVCPHEAIAVNGGRPVIDPDRCEPCGQCVPACPTGALRLAGSSAAQVEAQLRVLLGGAVEGVLFACAAAERSVPSGWFEVELPALSLVTPGWILQTLARGAPAVRLAACQGECCAGAERSVAFCRRLLEGLGDQHATARVEAGPAPPPLRPGTAELTLREPRATAEALLALTEADLLISDEASPLGLLTLSPERCTVCGACATICPTRAFALEEDAEETALQHDPSRCIHCGLCVEACPEGALEVHPGLDLGRLRRGVVTLIRSGRETCSACGAELPPRPMRKRVRELLAEAAPAFAEAPLDLCAGCLSASRNEKLLT